MLFDGSKFLRRAGRPSPTAAAQPSPGASLLGHDDQGRPVLQARPDNRTAQHLLLLAASGSGKSVLLAWQLLQEVIWETNNVPRDQWQCLFVADPKNDTATLLLEGIFVACPERARDIVWLNPFDRGFDFNLNHLAIPGVSDEVKARLVADVTAIVSTASGAAASGGAGSRQLDAWLHAILGSLTITDPRAHVLLAAEALATEAGQKRLAALTKSPQAREFLQDATLSEELRSSTTARLRLCFGATDMQARIFSSNRALDLGDLLGAGKIVLLPVGDPPGGLKSLKSLWINLFGRFVIERLLSRPSPWRGHHARIVLDEVQEALVLEDAIERIATVGRSKGVSGIYASQGTTLIADASSALLKVLRSNTPTAIIGRSNFADARQFSAEQAPLPGVDEAPHAVQQKIMASILSLPDRHFWLLRPGQRVRFQSADVAVDEWRRNADQQAAVVAAIKARHGLADAQQSRVTLKDLMPEKPPRAASTRPRSRFG